MNWLTVLGRLKPGVTITQAEADLNLVAENLAKLHPKASENTKINMQDGSDIGIFRRPSGGTWAMLGVGGVPFCPGPVPLELQRLWGLPTSGCHPS